MTDQTPAEITNLDRYGYPELPWSRPRDLLAASPTQSDITFFLGTVRPDGRPHAAAIGALWLDGDLYFTSGPETRKARNLAANPACTISCRLEGIDLVLEGDATRVADGPTLEQVAGLYRAVRDIAEQLSIIQCQPSKRWALAQQHRFNTSS